MCRQAGVSTREADKFMAMLYLCHGFYKLPDININTATLSRFGASTARRLWDTIKTEGLKQGGIGKIKSSVETETERLNREVKEAIANGTAKIISRNIDFDEKTEKGKRESITTDWTKKGLSKMALMMRGDYHGQRLEEISSANQENLKHGYYVLSEEEKKILRENDNDISSIYKALEKAGHKLLPDLRKKAGLEEKKRNASGSHEENRLFFPTKKAKEEIKKFCGEDIRIFNNLFPAFNGNISEDIIFCALHRSYKLGKAASALGSRMRGMLTNILEQIRNRAYAPNPWDEVLGNPAFAEWPLKEYGQRLKTYKESLQNIKQPETSWGQRAWQALGRFFPQYTEENRKVAEAEKREVSVYSKISTQVEINKHTVGISIGVGNNYSISGMGIEKLINHEGGFRYQVYSTRDATNTTPYREMDDPDWTIGLGHSIQNESELSKYWPKGGKRKVISHQEAEAIFREDLKEFETAVNSAFRNIPITQNQFNALVSYSFNRGRYIFKENRDGYPILQAMKEGNTKKAAEILKDSYPRGESKRIYYKGWNQRRQAEAQLFLTP